MLKYLLLALLFFLVLWSPAVRALFRGNPRKAPPPTPGPTSQRTGSAGTAHPDTIVPCAHCGVHLPLKEAQFDVGGRTYCGEAHRLSGPRQN